MVNVDKNIIKKLKSFDLYSFFKDVMIICIGLIISSFGISLFYQTGMGSGAMATFCDGLHLLLNVSYGTTYMVANIVFLILLLICDKNMINVGTIMCVFLIGIFVDLGNSLFGLFPIATSNVVIRFICMLAGCMMMGIGLALYVAVDRGFGALEGIVKYLCARTKISFSKIKIGQDLLLLSVGILLNASWGIGTLISAVTVGPIMKVFMVKFQKMLKKPSVNDI